MTALVVTVFVASLLGSLHCAGMCGAFVVLCTSGSPEGRGRWAAPAAYHGGRLVTYTILGAVAGALGAGLDLTGGVFGLQRIALAGAGVAMIAFGLAVILRRSGARVPTLGAPGPLRRLVARGYGAAQRMPPVPRAAAIGLLSTFLPCGWLYAFAVTAAGTGSAPLGAITMAVFWTGTLPVLVGLGAGVTSLAGPLRRHVPAATAAALVVVGLMAVAGRFRVPPLAAPAAWADEGPPALAVQARRVRDLDENGLPCCDEAP